MVQASEWSPLSPVRTALSFTTATQSQRGAVTSGARTSWMVWPSATFTAVTSSDWLHAISRASLTVSVVLNTAARSASKRRDVCRRHPCSRRGRTLAIAISARN